MRALTRSPTCTRAAGPGRASGTAGTPTGGRGRLCARGTCGGGGRRPGTEVRDVRRAAARGARGSRRVPPPTSPPAPPHARGLRPDPSVRAPLTSARVEVGGAVHDDEMQEQGRRVHLHRPRQEPAEKLDVPAKRGGSAPPGRAPPGGPRARRRRGHTLLLLGSPHPSQARAPERPSRGATPRPLRTSRRAPASPAPDRPRACVTPAQSQRGALAQPPGCRVPGPAPQRVTQSASQGQAPPLEAPPSEAPPPRPRPYEAPFCPPGRIAHRALPRLGSAPAVRTLWSITAADRADRANSAVGTFR